MNMSISAEKLNMEKIYVEIKKLFILRKNYTSMPIKSIQNGIVKITDYKLYDQMSEEEVKSAVNQVMVTDKFKQSVLSDELTDFFVQGNNNLTNGLEFPFRIISSCVQRNKARRKQWLLQCHKCR